jgi:integrase
MTGWIETRTVKDGAKTDGSPRYAKRFDACFRAGGRKKSKTFGTRKAAERFLVGVVGRLNDGTYREVVPEMFAAFATRWLAGLSDLKPSTRRAYASIVRARLIPAFGGQRLDSVTVEAVNAMLAASQDRLRVKTRQNVLGVLHKLFADARDAGHVAVNRLDSKALRRPRAIRADDTGDVEILQPAEIHRLLDAVAPEHYPAFMVAVLTGVRLGELLGLQWGDVDWTGARLLVRRSAWKRVLLVPKTRGSRRAIDVGPQLLAVLGRHRRDRFGDGEPPAEAPLFPDHDGRPWDGDRFRKAVWLPTLTRAGLPRARRFHSLRHSFTSLQLTGGATVKYVSAMLGHASAAITLNRYQHVLPGERAAADRLEATVLLSSGTYPAKPAEPPGTSTNRVGDGTAATPRRD